MVRTMTIRLVLAALALFCAPALPAQTVVDRIAARIEDDVIFQSEVRELGLYQQLVNGRAEAPDKLLTERIEQWIVKTEAAAAIFPRPSEADAERALAELKKHFAPPGAFEARLSELGLSASSVREMLAEQLYLSRYLEYKFRPAAQVESEAIEKYYRDEFLPALKEHGQPPLPVEAVREQIRELLVQQEISKRAAQWLEEARSRLKIEVLHREGSEPGKPERE